MLAFMSFALRIKNREHDLRTSYRKGHPHFYVYLAIDALLTMGLVFGVVSVASSLTGESASHLLLTKAGGHAMTSAELVASAAASTLDGEQYWLGAFTGYT